MSWINRGMMVGQNLTFSNPIRRLTFANSVTVSDKSGARVPMNTQAGDFLLHVEFSQGLAASPTIAVPTGFTHMSNTSCSAPRISVATSYKIANGTEANTTLSTAMAGDDEETSHLLVFRPVGFSISSVSYSISSEQTSSNPASQIIDASAVPYPVIIFGYYGTLTVNAFSPRTFTGATEDAEIEELDSGPDLISYLKYKVYTDQNGPIPVITIDMEDEGLGNSLVAGYIRLL